MPAAAVTPAPQVGITIIWPKASVAGLINLLLNHHTQCDVCGRDCQTRDREELEVFVGER